MKRSVACGAGTLALLALRRGLKGCLILQLSKISGFGTACFDIYPVENQGPWNLWKQAVPQTASLLCGQMGHSYAFCSMAMDDVGNRETPKISGDAPILGGLSRR